MRESENLDSQAKKLFIIEKKINIFLGFLLARFIAILVANSFLIIKKLKNIEYNTYLKN